MGSQLIYDYENKKENNGVYVESLEPRAQAKGDVVMHSENTGTLPSGSGDGDTKGSALCPITPISDRECLRPESLVDVDLFQFNRNEEIVASAIDSSPRTPRESVFDPFAPGPDEMCLAPIRNKKLKVSQKNVVRGLGFDDIDDCAAYKGDDNYVDWKLQYEDC